MAPLYMTQSHGDFADEIDVEPKAVVASSAYSTGRSKGRLIFLPIAWNRAPPARRHIDAHVSSHSALSLMAPRFAVLFDA